MEILLMKYMPMIQMVCYVLSALCIVATLVVRLTPSKLDDEKVSKVVKYILKFLSYLPTIGINPKTKKLEEAYKKLNEK